MKELAYCDGRFLPFKDITVGIGTHAFNYGTSVFEGLRAYWNADLGQLLLFRAKEHFERLHASAKLFGMRLPHSVEDLCRVSAQLLTQNESRQDVYLRPVLFKSSSGVGLWRSGLEDSFVIYQVPMGAYMATEGIRCCVSSWRRVDGNAAPVRAKIGGIYAAMALARHEAMILGFDEAITLAANGCVAEGTAENIFLVLGGKLVTPQRGEDVLAGITRASVIELAATELGMVVEERAVNRSELYSADEVFLCGTAAEVTAVLQIDGRSVGAGKMGSITRLVRDLYQDVVHGRRPEYLGWCRPISGDELAV